MVHIGPYQRIFAETNRKLESGNNDPRLLDGQIQFIVQELLANHEQSIQERFHRRFGCYPSIERIEQRCPSVVREDHDPAAREARMG